MMKASLIEVIIILAALRNAEGLLNDAVSLRHRTRRIQTHAHSKKSLSPCCSLDQDDVGAEDADTSRRGFLNCVTTAFVGLGLDMNANVRDASAVDFPTPGSIKGNQRAGGLANKIRNSCRVMVSFISV